MGFTIRFELIEYGVKKRDWYDSGSRRGAIAAETFCGSLKAHYFTGLPKFRKRVCGKLA